MIAVVNEQSLQRVNAFLGAVAERTQVGEVLSVTPAEMGRDLGFPDPLVDGEGGSGPYRPQAAGAGQGSYRLLAPSLSRQTRRSRSTPPSQAQKSRRADGRGRMPSDSRRLAYSDLGRAVVDKLIDLGRETAQLRASFRTAREETRSLRAARDDAEGRAHAHAEKHRELESRAEMAESNLRTLLASVRASSTRGPAADARVSDSEMEAILGVLKGNDARRKPTRHAIEVASGGR